MPRFKVDAVFRAVDKTTRVVSRIQNRVSRYTRAAKKGIKAVERQTDRLADGTLKLVKRSAMLGTVGAAGLAAYAHMANKATIETTALAESVGVTSRTINGLGKEIEGAGFNTENIVDLVEEMNNKLGESAGLETITPVTESLKILGLEFDKLKKKKPEEQFKAIMDATLKLNDAQKASAAADILMGGEANRIVGILRKKGGSIDDILLKFDALNFMTKDGIEGAKEYGAATKDLGTLLGSLGQLFSGLAGQHIAPLIRKLTDWLKVNKDLIKTGLEKKIKDMVAVAKELWPEIKQIVTQVKDWVGGMDGLFEKIEIFVDLTAYLFGLVAVVKILTVSITLLNAVMAMNPIGLIVIGIAAAIGAIILLIKHWDKVKATFIGFPEPVKLALKIAFAPLYGLIKLAELVIKNWDVVKSFFVGFWEGLKDQFSYFIDKFNVLMDKVRAVKGFFGFGDDEESDEEKEKERERRENATRSPSMSERIARSIEEKRNSEKGELVITDETGRAESSGALPAGMQLISSEAM